MIRDLGRTENTAGFSSAERFLNDGAIERDTVNIKEQNDIVLIDFSQA